MNAEQLRLEEARARAVPWRKWGPYLSERQWGTVREDYSDNGAGIGASHQTGWTGTIARHRGDDLNTRVPRRDQERASVS